MKIKPQLQNATQKCWKADYSGPCLIQFNQMFVALKLNWIHFSFYSMFTTWGCFLGELHKLDNLIFQWWFKNVMTMYSQFVSPKLKLARILTNQKAINCRHPSRQTSQSPENASFFLGTKIRYSETSYFLRSFSTSFSSLFINRQGEIIFFNPLWGEYQLLIWT